MKKSIFVTFILVVTFVFPIMSNAMAPPPPPFAFPLPPPIPFVTPPELVIIPDTDIYAVPDFEDDLFFHQGWWWRYWDGRWYRSRHYDRGCVLYNSIPSFYFDVHPAWRGNFKNRTWHVHIWTYKKITHDTLHANWHRWKKDRTW